MAKKIIKAQMKQRQDTKANWAAANPVLLDGELGMVSDDRNLYKVGDGRTAWNDLPFRGFDGTLAQELGTSANAAISQKAVTEKLTELSAAMSEISNEMSDNLADLSDDLDILRTEPTQEELIGEDTAYEIVNNASSQIGVGGSNYKGKLFSVKRNDKITITGEVVDGLSTIALCSFVESFEIGAKADILRASLPKGKVNIEYLVPKTGYIFVQTQFSSSLMIEGLSVTKEIKGSIQTEFGKEYNKDAYIVNAYIDNEGKIVSNDSYRCTDFIPMLPTTIRFSNIASSPYFSSIAFYDKNKNTLLTIGNKGNNVRVTASDIPHNATYFRVCSPTNLYEQSAIIISPLQTAIIERIGLMNHLRKTASVKKSTFNSGEQMSLQTPIVAKNKDISFYGRVSSFNRITIQSGNATAFARCKVAIDSTHIYLYSSINSDFNTPINAYLHGLTISEFIDVKIKVGVDGEAVVYLSTLSGEFEQKISDWSYCYNTTFVTNGGSSLSDCALTFSSSDFSKDIWLVGDSYLTYWTPFARVKGYDNFLQMGRPGSASEEALQSVKTALNHGTPKTIIWAIGMNNADEGGINAIWKSCLDSLIEICSSKGIELILSTIPNTPSKDNSYKNAVVRESGYRYVDICSAVGADSSSSWYSGLLGYDPHPSEVDGSRVIANRFIADIPEIRNS